MTNLAERLKETREAAGYTQKRLAREAGITQQSLQKIEAGLVHNPRKLLLIESLLGLPPGYLLYGTEKASELLKPIIARCPILNESEALNWPANKDSLTIKSENRLASEIILSPTCFAFKISDDSMVHFLKAEGFHPGKYILVDPEKKPAKNNYVVAQVGQQLLFRKFINDAGKLKLIPLNMMMYENISITNDIKIKGVVVAYLDLLI